MLTVLRARGLAVPDAVRERILPPKDPERLERWLEKAGVSARFPWCCGGLSYKMRGRFQSNRTFRATHDVTQQA